jgi:hypothetical protein
VHELKLRTGELLKQDAGDMLRAADAGGTLGRLTRIGLEPGDELLEVVGRRKANSPLPTSISAKRFTARATTGRIPMLLSCDPCMRYFLVRRAPSRDH